METRIGWRRRLAALLLAVVLLVPCMPRALAADLNVDAGFYLKQSRSGTCTLTAAAMMLRRRAYLDGLADWVDVTENSVRPAAWSNGLSHSFTYKAMKVRYATLPADNGAKAQTLIDLLAAHPEGIVLYDRRQPHAILLTDYTDGVFYCSDPAGNITAGRVPISSASVSIAGASCYWYIAEDNNAAAGASQTGELQLAGIEVEAALAGAFGQLFDAAVEDITAAVEDHVGDAFFCCLLGDHLAHLAGGLFVAAVAVKALIQGGCGAQGAAGGVVDDLGIDIGAGAEHVQAGPLGRAGDLPAHSLVAAEARLVCICLIDHYFSLLLPIT